MPSPCSPVSRPLKASMVVAAAAAQWPRRPHHPHRTSPMPLAALQHPAGQLQPRPQEARSTISRSRPCGLRHPLPRLQTGLPWLPNRPPQNQGPTLPWRQRDKGGPSPPPGGQNPVGWGRGCLCGPLHPSSVCTPIPQSPGGERLDYSQAVLCQHSRLHPRKFTAQAPPARMDLTQSGLGA